MEKDKKKRKEKNWRGSQGIAKIYGSPEKLLDLLQQRRDAEAIAGGPHRRCIARENSEDTRQRPWLIAAINCRLHLV